MNIENICEYLNGIGILKLEDMNRFLNIYKQIYQNKIKNKTEKFILALFSYITIIANNEKQLYETCKSIVNKYSNNQILYRYRSLYMLNNIIKSKIFSRYVSFFWKLNCFINRQYFIFHSPKIIKSNSRNIIHNVYGDKENINNMNLSDRNKIKYNNIKKGKIIKKNYSKKKIKDYNNNNNLNIDDNNKNDNNYRTFDFYDNQKECTLSQKINKNNKLKIINKLNNQINDEIDSSSYFNKSNDNKSNRFIPKNKSFKHSANYANNNKINDELEKMVENISKYSGTPNNVKYIPKKPSYRTVFNQMYPTESYKEMPFYSYPNINEDNNNLINDYYKDDYDFYQNEEDFIKKVQDKIFMMKIKKMDQISRECTFSPEINEVPKYLYENKKGENNMADINLNYEDNYKNKMYSFNNNYIDNSFNNSQSFSKKRKNQLTENYIDDNYNLYPKRKKNRSKDSRSYSNSKRKNNEFHIYKDRKEQLMKQLKQQYPFMPSIKSNKNFPIQSTFDERQKKLIEDKQKKFKEKEAEELKAIEEMKKYYNKSKANIKELVEKLYDKEAEKIKERIKKEKEEKSNKKKVIDWEKRNKKYKEKYPDDYKNNYKYKKNKTSNNSLNKPPNDNIPGRKEKSKTKSKENIFNNNARSVHSKSKSKNKNDIIPSKEEINKNKQLLLDKIKDEHIIGFKNNSIPNTNKNNIINNEISLKKDEVRKEEKVDNVVNDTINTMKESENFNFDNDSILKTSEKKENDQHILDGVDKKEGIRSAGMRELMNQLHNK